MTTKEKQIPVFKGTCTLEDQEAREIISILETKIATINERTKRQTLQIRELQKQVKELLKR